MVDRDHSSLSRTLVRMIDANEYVRVTMRLCDLEAAKEKVFKREVGGAVVIPEGFSRSLLRGGQARVAAYLDGSYFLVYRQTLTGLVETCGTMSAGIEIRRMEAAGAATAQAEAARDPLPLRAYALFNPAGGYASYVVPAVLVLLLQQSLLIGMGMRAGTLREAGERKSGNESHSGASAVPEVLGKAGAYMSIYLLHGVYIFLVLFRVYRFPQRADPFTLAMVIVPFLAACVFMGIAVTSFFRTREGSMLVLLCGSIPVLFMAGIAWPSQSMPLWLTWLSRAIPSTAGMDAFIRVNQMGASLYQVLDEVLLLWVLAGVYFITALVMSGARTPVDCVHDTFGAVGVETEGDVPSTPAAP